FIIYTAVLGGRILTPEILIEEETMRSIKRAAEEELKSLRGRSINDVFSAGLRFAKKIEIHPPDVIEAAERLAEAGFPSSPVMIGSTVAVYVPPEIANSYFRNENLSFNSPSSIWAQREVMEALKRRFDSLLEDFHIVFSRVSEIDSLGARILLK
ncbi:MAG: hypothetical protein J7L88_04860, partial [Thermoplasmata archaeon]|nr:hypothetical protein [Thermoplasmata archaeon]